MPAPESEMTVLAHKAANSLSSIVTRQEIYDVMCALAAAAHAQGKAEGLEEAAKQWKRLDTKDTVGWTAVLALSAPASSKD